MLLAATVMAISLTSTARVEAAGPYDPDVEYNTLTTPHFYVMYPTGYGQLALRTAHIAEQTYPYLRDRYQWEPAARTAIVLNDQTDSANGSAQLVPSKIVTLFITAPTRVSGLEEYDDWLTAVLIHEMAHIFHLDMAYGLPWLGRLIFGKYIAMNSYTPGWVTEGLAVYEETVSTSAGRGRSTYVDMVIRTAALEDRFPPIDQGYRGYPRWPFGNIAYFFGGRFQLWLRERYGEEKLLAYHRAYAANPIPYFTYLPAKLKFGASIEALWNTWEEEARADAVLERERIRSSALAVTEPTRLTQHGGESVGPSITPDGRHIVFSTSSPVDGPRVRRITVDGTEDEVLLNDTLSQAISFTADGNAFYYTQTEINQRFYRHNNLLRYSLERGSAEPVTLQDEEASKAFVASSGSLRARDPDISPDGKQLVFVQNWFGANRMVVADVASDGLKITPKEIVAPEPDVQLANPRFSPDGALIAVSRFAGGRRDVVVYDVQGRRVLDVTRDRAQDTDPEWSPDGRFLVFSSDRTGIYNLYAYDFAQGELRQLTNLITGAFQPSISPDGRFVVFRGYSSDGFDVYRTAFDPSHGVVVPRDLDPPTSLDEEVRDWPPKTAGAPEVPAPALFSQEPLDPEALPEDWDVGPYSALDTILPFNDNWNLFPALAANEQEIFGSLTHIGADARFTHSYVLNVTYGTSTNFVGGAAGYSNDVLEPTFSMFGSAEAVIYGTRIFAPVPDQGPCPYGGQIVTVSVDGTNTPVCPGSRNGQYIERQLAASFSLGLPVKQRHLLSAAYIFDRRDPLDEILPGSLVTSALPRSGNFARVRLGYTYANVRRFPFSVSTERGPVFGIALSALSKGLGSDFEQLLLTTEARYYLSLPWTAKWLTNHVIATRLGVGVGFGPDLAQLFRLGGVEGQSAVTTTTDDFYGLRGFASSVLIGPAVISGSTEYRAPLFRVDRGVGTLPFTLRVLHAAVFADYGRVFEDTSRNTLRSGWPEEVAVGVGGELRADVIFFYGLPLTLRVGYAYPVVVPKSLEANGEASGLYLQIGNAF